MPPRITPSDQSNQTYPCVAQIAAAIMSDSHDSPFVTLPNKASNPSVAKTGRIADEGVHIPVLLQNLLGVEFLPYVREEVGEDVDVKTTEEEEEDDLLPSFYVGRSNDEEMAQPSSCSSLESAPLSHILLPNETESPDHVNDSPREDDNPREDDIPRQEDSPKSEEISNENETPKHVKKSKLFHKHHAKEEGSSAASSKKKKSLMSIKYLKNSIRRRRQKAITYDTVVSIEQDPTPVENHPEEEEEEDLFSQLSSQTSALDSTLSLLSQHEDQLSSVKHDISALESRTAEIVSHVEEISSKTQRLHQILLKHKEALESETLRMKECVSSLQTLDRQKQTLEHGIGTLEDEVEQRNRMVKELRTKLHPHETGAPRSLPSEIPESSSFMRVEDLPLSHINPPIDPSQLYPLDSPNYTLVIDALVQYALQCTSDPDFLNWTPTSSTVKNLRKPLTDQILVWSAKFNHAGYGSDYPVVKSRAMIDATPSEIVEMLQDSSRCKEYNKLSVGRTDQYLFPDKQTKIIRSLNKPPVVRRPIEFVSLFHIRAVPGGYICVSRSVSETSEGVVYSGEVTRSEMLLGVNLMRDVDGKTEFTAVTQVYAPGVPLVLGKTVGLKSAYNFLRDIQKLYE